jgi:DMSO/TMAO reductase YedYZ molybdopterin-dependent catalytic subunit
MKCLLFSVVLLLDLALIGSAQPKEEPSIIVAGIIERKRITVMASELGKLPKRTATIKTDKGTAMTFEGVALRDILEQSGVNFGQRLHGARLMAFVVVEGAPPSLSAFSLQDAGDYRALFSLPELDPTFTDQQPVILALTQDGKPLSAADGPFRLVVPSEKRTVRWIKDVKMIYVLHADSILNYGAYR